MTTQPISSVPADVADFVTRVRAALADLPPDDVDELTAGLAADLADARAEAPNGWREGVGSPEAYAAELRSAAGLPPRGPVADPTPLDGLRQWWASLATHPVAGRVQREAHDLAPAWWVIRGGLGGLVVSWGLLGLGLKNPLAILTAGLGAAVSVWLGRHLRAGAGSGWRLASAVCTILALWVGFVLASVSNPLGVHDFGAETYVPQELMNQGEQVTELYGFDGEGRRVDGLRVFDQSGRPLTVYTHEGFQTDAFPWRSWDQTFSPDEGYVDGQLWTPPLTLPAAPGAISTETSTSTSGPTSSSSSSSSSGSTTKRERAESSPKPTASPRSTASPSD